MKSTVGLPHLNRPGARCHTQPGLLVETLFSTELAADDKSAQVLEIT